MLSKEECQGVQHCNLERCIDSMWMLTTALLGSRLQGQECKRETAAKASSRVLAHTSAELVPDRNPICTSVCSAQSPLTICPPSPWKASQPATSHLFLAPSIRAQPPSVKSSKGNTMAGGFSGSLSLTDNTWALRRRVAKSGQEVAEGDACEACYEKWSSHCSHLEWHVFAQRMNAPSDSLKAELEAGLKDAKATPKPWKPQGVQSSVGGMAEVSSAWGRLN